MTSSKPPASSATEQPLVFFGTEDFSVASLEALIGHGFPVAAVVTKPDTPRGRNRSLTPPAVKTLAQAHGIPVLQPTKLDDAFVEELYGFIGRQPGVMSGGVGSHESLLSWVPSAPENAQRMPRFSGADQAAGPADRKDVTMTGVLVSYGKIIPQKVLDIFTPGIINVHPSLLPKYRGPSPIEAAILNGDEQTGISIMQLVAKMDAGPIYVQKAYRLDGTETKPQLYTEMAQRGAELLIEHLPEILNGEILAKAQDESAASYCSLLHKDDGQLLPELKSAVTLEREVRAYLGFPKSRTSLFGHDIIVTSARVTGSEQDGAIVLPCAGGTFLSIEHLIAPSGRAMSAADFVRGYKK